MNPAREIGGAITHYPYALRPTAKHLYPEVSPLPGTWEQCTPEQLAALHCVDVQSVAPPVLADGDTCSEGSPEYVGGVWRHAWTVTAAPPEPVPQSVESHKIKIALTALGWRTEVEELVATSSQSIKDAWTAPFMSRDSVLLNQCAMVLGKTEAQVDGLFRMAYALVT